jgi:DNA-binding transcriptional ArsR family regulator
VIDPVRLAILRGLADGEARVVDLTRRLGLAQATVSAHLTCLRAAAAWSRRVRSGGPRCTP